MSLININTASFFRGKEPTGKQNTLKLNNPLAELFFKLMR